MPILPYKPSGHSHIKQRKTVQCLFQRMTQESQMALLIMNEARRAIHTDTKKVEFKNKTSLMKRHLNRHLPADVKHLRTMI